VTKVSREGIFVLTLKDRIPSPDVPGLKPTAMTELHRQLSDDAFLRQFEEATLGAEVLSHEAHFRIAWIYLSRLPFDEALDKITDGIQRFDRQYAGGRKYHATITRAYMLLIHHRIQKQDHPTWAAFLHNNRDLLKPVGDVLLRYYQAETLFSDRARTEFLRPDRAPAPLEKEKENLEY
jgi:hypothetical protein